MLTLLEKRKIYNAIINSMKEEEKHNKRKNEKSNPKQFFCFLMNILFPIALHINEKFTLTWIF